MLNIEQYYKEIIQFVNGLVFKFDEIRIHQNYHSFVKHGLRPPEIIDSKYYQDITCTNKNGELMTYNGRPLTREILNENIIDKTILLKFDTEFYNLCLTYPGMSDYVRGSLLDITMDELIALDNYSIIHYNKDFLSENEAGLIVEIEEYIKMIMESYHNKLYISDELYISNLLKLIYDNLTLFIVSKKFEKIMTNEVDTFHISHKLSSFKNMYENTQIFDLPTNIWLYGNVDRLKKNTGKNKTLNEVLTTILGKNGYGVFSIGHKSTLPTLIDNNVADITKEYYKHNYSCIAMSANKQGYNITNKEYTVDKLNTLLVENNLVKEISTFDMDNEDSELTKLTGEYLTNLFVLDRPENINVKDTNNFVYTISNLLSKIHNNDYTFYIDYYNDLDSKLYKLSMYDIRDIIVSLLYKNYNIKSDTFDIKCYGIFNNKLTKASILNTTWYKDKIDPIYEYIINIPYLQQAVITPDTLKTSIKATRQLDGRVWFALSNIVDSTAKADIVTISKLLTYDETYTYNINDVHSRLDEKLLDVFYKSGTLDTLWNLLYVVTGLEIDTTKGILDRFESTVKVFDSLTSYTVNLTIDNDFTSTINNNSISAGINLGYKPLLEVNNMEHMLYSELDFYVKTTEFLTTITHSIDSVIPGITSNANSLPILHTYGIDLPTSYSTTKILNGVPYRPKHSHLDLSTTLNVVTTSNAIPKALLSKQFIPVVADYNKITLTGTAFATFNIIFNGLPYKFSSVRSYRPSIVDRTHILSTPIVPKILPTIPKHTATLSDIHTPVSYSYADGMNSNFYKPSISSDTITENITTLDVTPTVNVTSQDVIYVNTTPTITFADTEED